MHYLILGGTRFVGRHIAEAAISRGHKVTLFHRGQSAPDAVRAAEHVLADRDGGLDALGDRTFDRVVDVSGYVPRIVRASAEYLADRTEHYTYISTESVYADITDVGLDEDAPKARIEDPSTEEITAESYGPLKYLCEEAVHEVYGGRSLFVRPGYVVGPGDYTDRFTYWVRRVAGGGDVAAPGEPHRLIQVIDGRDLGDWVIWMADRRRFGPYNASGPEYMLTWGLLLHRIRYMTGSDAEFHWIDDETVISSGIDMPLFVPKDENSSGHLHVDSSRAIADGLLFRSLAETITDTYEWSSEAGPVSVGPSREEEAKLLEIAASGTPSAS